MTWAWQHPILSDLLNNTVALASKQERQWHLFLSTTPTPDCTRIQSRLGKLLFPKWNCGIPNGFVFLGTPQTEFWLSFRFRQETDLPFTPLHPVPNKTARESVSPQLGWIHPMDPSAQVSRLLHGGGAGIEGHQVPLSELRQLPREVQI